MQWKFSKVKDIFYYYKCYKYLILVLYFMTIMSSLVELLPTYFFGKAIDLIVDGDINGILRNDKYPFAIANIDRAVVGEKAFLECKVTNSFNKKEWIKTIPIHYKIQMNHYMAVTGASHCYVAVLIGNEELVIHKLERD